MMKQQAANQVQQKIASQKHETPEKAEQPNCTDSSGQKISLSEKVSPEKDVTDFNDEINDQEEPPTEVDDHQYASDSSEAAFEENLKVMTMILMRGVLGN